MCFRQSLLRTIKITLLVGQLLPTRSVNRFYQKTKQKGLILFSRLFLRLRRLKRLRRLFNLPSPTMSGIQNKLTRTLLICYNLQSASLYNN